MNRECSKSAQEDGEVSNDSRTRHESGEHEVGIHVTRPFQMLTGRSSDIAVAVTYSASVSE
jgi:hypothetical protein